MKDINEIERLTPEDLERIASDESVRVPADLKASLEALAGASKVLEDRPTASGVFHGFTQKRLSRKSSSRPSQGLRTCYWAVPAVAAALVAAVLVFRSQPKDTFSDPYLAYAEVQKAFGQISEKGEAAAAIAGNAVPVMEKTEDLLNRLMK